MTTFQIGDRVTPKAIDSKLGLLHGIILIITRIGHETISVKSEDGKYLSGNMDRGITFGPRPENYYPDRFELIESIKIDTIENRIKKLYSKCKTTAHWA